MGYLACHRSGVLKTSKQVFEAWKLYLCWVNFWDFTSIMTLGWMNLYLRLVGRGQVCMENVVTSGAPRNSFIKKKKN